MVVTTLLLQLNVWYDSGDYLIVRGSPMLVFSPVLAAAAEMPTRAKNRTNTESG
jgi:hypothetical protein